MSDDRINLTRRKILASVGAVGAAGAAAGLGSSALYSDVEQFANNTITAGELDLKVDWEEHYSFPQIYEGFEDPTAGLNATMEEPDNPGGFVAFPPGVEADDGSDPLLWVDAADVDEYMDNTSLEAFPDADNDGTGEFPVEDMLPDLMPCDVLADVPNDLGTYTTAQGGDVLARTDNADTRLDNQDPAPLINLDDVKPGDFGEVTFSTHICDNPAYLWMQMPGGLNLDENGVEDPESDSPEEEEGVVELADELRTAIWYDNNCDNLTVEEEKLDVIGVLDTSGSIDGNLNKCNGGSPTGEIAQIAGAIDTFLGDLPTDDVGGEPRVRAGLLTFNGNVEEGSLDGCEADVEPQPALRQGLTAVDDIGPAAGFLPSQGSGDSPMPHAIDLAHSVLSDQGRDDARQVIVLVTDGLPDFNEPNQAGPNYEVTDPDSGVTYQQDLTYDQDGPTDSNTTVQINSNDVSTCDELDETGRAADLAKGSGIDILGVGIGLGDTVCDPDGDGNPIAGDTFLVNSVVGLQPGQNIAEPDQFFDPDNFADLNAVAQAIVAQLVGAGGDGDEIIFTGTLREAEAVLTGDGLALDGDRSTEFDELNDPDDDADRELFPTFTTSCFGFSWWLPRDVGNEVQSDTVGFDLGFVAQQSRNNDGNLI